MTPGKFLRLLWPDQGPYCIAHPYKLPDGKTVYSHKVFSTISEAVTHCHEQANLQDVYFAVLSLKEKRVWDPNKTDYKTGQKGAYAVRLQSNMAQSKTLFFDLDVGSDPGKYPTQNEAMQGLADFLVATKLPVPTLVSSGGGIHVYWHISAPIDREECRRMQWHMRQLAEGIGLKPDPARTTDMSSVLRVPDTYNWKDRSNPRPVKVMGDHQGAITPVEDLKRIISDAMIAHGIVATEPPTTHAPAGAIKHDLGEQAAFNDFGPPPTVAELGDACAQVREMIRSQTDPSHAHYGPFDNTAWYRGMLATIKHVENGDDLCRKLTALHPRSVSDVEAKLMQLERFAPAKCETLQQALPWKDAPCQGCKFRDKVPNPFVAARRNTPAPPPGATPPLPAGVDVAGTSSATPPPPAPSVGAQQLVAPNLSLIHAAIPNPPKPFERLKSGGLAVTRKDKDGNETKTQFLDYDLYPLRRLVNKNEQREQQTWRVTLPRSGHRDFTIDADVLYDSRKFTAAISHNGVYPNKGDIPALQDYMVAYISQLQKTLDADNQSSHLGWADEYQQFILPDKTLRADGTVTTSSLTLAAERASQHLRKRGDANKQRQLLEFYNKPGYVANQFVVLSSLASIIFDMTGHHGIIVNCSGEAGASKSTTLYTAMGLWGDAVMWAINGTNRGATANARMARVASNGNLPTGVDEITHIPSKEMIDLAMSVTQPGHRLRLDTSGAERKVDDGYKSAIMITTANSSLHSLLSQDNAAGTAGSMRVFEIKFFAKNLHTKAEADAYLRELKENYGHLGEVFAHFVIRNRDKVAKRVHQIMEEIDREASIIPSERFWSAVIAVVYVTAEICEALKLAPYSAEAIRRWAVDTQIPYMRGIVREEYRNPLAILTDYIAERNSNIVVIDKSTSIGANTAGKAVASDTAFAVSTPHGSLLGHYDLKAGVLLLLKQGFRDHCSRIGASASRILEELSTPTGHNTGPVVVDRNCRRTLGAGTNIAKGQAWCFAVNMHHPDVAGIRPTLVATSPAPANDAKEAS